MRASISVTSAIVVHRGVSAQLARTRADAGAMWNWLLLSLCLVGCLPEALAPPSDASPPPRVLAITIVEERPLRIRVASEAPLALDAAQLLRSGDRSDEDLLTALARATPPRWATSLIVETEVTSDDEGLLLAPRDPLEDGSYVVAVSARARAKDGSALGGIPLLERFFVATPPPRARLVATIPADGSASVPTSIRSIVLAFDGPLRGLEGNALTRDGVAIDASSSFVRCDESGLDAAACVALVPRASLERGARYVIVCDGASDIDGGDVPAASAAFETAQSELDPLAIEAISCGLDEIATPIGCVLSIGGRALVRVRASRAATFTLTTGTLVTRRFAPRGEAELALSVGLGEHTLALEAQDLAGASATRNALVTVGDSPPIVIDEIYGDPLGPEPDAEWVELVNAGREAILLGGFTITDDPFREGDPLPSVTLPARTALLVVGPRFDETSDLDPSIPAGAAIARLSSSIGAGGIANRGEPLMLRDAEGRRVASAPALPFEPGRCLVRDGETYHLAECTPGRAESPP